jgi:acyl-CoA synthetase (AMP-forming)/AMP-acid ligase II
MNLLDFFDAGVASYPDAPCFVDCGRDAPAITYEQAGALTCQIARGLQTLGLAPGFHGAVLSGNAGAAFVALLGVLRAGGGLATRQCAQQRGDQCRVPAGHGL